MSRAATGYLNNVPTNELETILSKEQVRNAFEKGKVYVNASMLLYNSLSGDMVMELLLCYSPIPDFKDLVCDHIVKGCHTDIVKVCELMVATFKKVMATNVKSIESLMQKIITISAWVFENQTMKLPRGIFYDMIDVFRNKTAMLMIAGVIREFFTGLANVLQYDGVQKLRSSVTPFSCAKDIPGILKMVAEVDTPHLAVFMKEHATQTSIWVDMFIFPTCRTERMRAIDMISDTYASRELLIHEAVSDYMCDRLYLRREISYENVSIAAIEHKDIEIPPYNGVVLHFNTYPRICKTTRNAWNQKVCKNRLAMSEKHSDSLQPILTRRIERKVYKMICVDSRDIFKEVRRQCGVGGMSFEELCQHLTSDSSNDHILQHSRCLLEMFQVSISCTDPLLRERIIDSLGQHVNSVFSQTCNNYPDSVFTSSSSLYQREFVVGVHTRTMYDNSCFMKVRIETLNIRKQDMKGITTLGRRMPEHNKYLTASDKLDTKKQIGDVLMYGAMHLLPHIHVAIPFERSTCVFEIESLQQSEQIIGGGYNDHFCIMVPYDTLCRHPLLSHYLKDDDNSSLFCLQYKEPSMRILTCENVFIRAQDLKDEKQIYIACSFDTSYSANTIYLHASLYTEVRVLHMDIEPCR